MEEGGGGSRSGAGERDESPEGGGCRTGRDDLKIELLLTVETQKNGCIFLYGKKGTGGPAENVSSHQERSAKDTIF